jgi:uncharacterized membrane protein YagU involved in acid resistance
MENKFGNAILSGFIATIVMTMVIFLAPMMGLPKMNIPQILASMLGVSVVIGWIMHFMIGLIFAFVYVYWFNTSVHINSKAGKGLLYGILVLVFAMVMMFLMTRMMPAPEGMMGNMGLMILGALIGHLIYGLFVGLIVPLNVSSGHEVKHGFQTT